MESLTSKSISRVFGRRQKIAISYGHYLASKIKSRTVLSKIPMYLVLNWEMIME